MNIKVLTVSDNMNATVPLVNSLKKNNWDYTVIDTPFRGFGTKLIETYNYLKKNTEITHFIFCDAFDVVVLSSMTEVLCEIGEKYGIDKIVCSAERGCWPVPDWERYYTERFEHRFNYVNSGAYYAPRQLFINLFESDPPQYETDDQMWMTKQFLFNENSNIVLDNNQVIFNSHSFIDEGEYKYENGRIIINGNEPCIIHSNGRTVDVELDKLVSEL